jgi:hypothetical protein
LTRLGRGPALFLLLLLSWCIGRVLVTAWFRRRFWFDAEAAAQAFAVATLQWLALRGWRRPA